MTCLFWDSLVTFLPSSLLTTLRRWLTKYDQAGVLACGSVTSRNMLRWFGGCDWPAEHSPGQCPIGGGGLACLAWLIDLQQ